jgi:hypothetical protein
MRVIKLTRTSDACPTQWDAVTDDGSVLYLRYRWGWLTVEKKQPGGRFAQVFSKSYGGGLDGSMTFEQLQELTKDLITFDCQEESTCMDV